jgi:hypothetical protein
MLPLERDGERDSDAGAHAMLRWAVSIGLLAGVLIGLLTGGG